MGIAHIGARQRHLLPFATREFHPVIEAASEHLIESLRHARRDRVGEAAPRGLANPGFIAQCLDLTDADVLAQDEIVAHEILEDDADVFAETVEVVVAEIDPIQEDSALVGIVEARQQLHQRRLPGAVFPYQRDALMWLECEREPAHRPALRARIAEPHVLKAEAGLQRSRHRLGSGFRDNTGSYIEEREQIAQIQALFVNG